MKYPKKPLLECDVVMKGGITSGVIYPRAICKLAETYRLRSVGGSSAGAIAAAGAAAAEFGRQSGTLSGFELLETLPQDLTQDSPAGGSVLLRLFQPTKQSLPLYRAFTAGMGQPNRTRSIIKALLKGYWLRAMACAAPGLILIALCALGGGLALLGGGVSDAARSWGAGIVLLGGEAFLAWGCAITLGAGVVAGTALAVVGAVAGTAWGVVRTLAALPAKGFGMCTGMPDAGAKGADALTPWLHRELQAMAGRAEGGDVLTFGQLADSGIELRVMTTNLTRRQPMPLPWATQEYFFEPSEMRRLFPKDVVDWMIENPPADVNPDGSPMSDRDARRRALLRAQAGTKCPWPDGDRLPVIVATRMSLSFPLLITAVPLYAVDYSRKANRDARKAADAWLKANPDLPVEEGAGIPELRREFGVNWFSDGGICANLPVHFFDAVLPTRPTFAIDLQSFPTDLTKKSIQSQNCYLPINNGAGLLRPWTTLSTSGIKSLGPFLGQIVDTARGWLDAAQLVTPGYRDRVVTIFHDGTEGGMNLNMDATTVRDLTDRGEAAARMLVEKFAGTAMAGTPKEKPQGWGLNNQRWIRFRTAMSGQDAWLRKFKAGYEYPAPDAVPYQDLVGVGAQADLPSYEFTTQVNRNAANQLTGDLLTLANDWVVSDAFSDNAPRPRPQLRLSPDDGAAGLPSPSNSPTDAESGGVEAT